MNKVICVIIAAAAQVLAVSPSWASTVTYDLSATLSDGGAVTGDFTVSNGTTLSSFDLFLPTGNLPDPVPSQITKSNSSISIGLPLSTSQIQIYDSDSKTYFTAVNLFLTSLPTGSTPTSLGGGSDIQQAVYGNLNWDYIGGFSSSSITLANPPATPLPDALPLLAAGLGALGLLGWCRKRKAQPVTA